MPRLSYIRIVDDAAPARRPEDYARMEAWRLDSCEIARSKLRVLQRLRTSDDVAAENRVERLMDWWGGLSEPVPRVPVLPQPKTARVRAEADSSLATHQLPRLRLARKGATLRRPGREESLVRWMPCPVDRTTTERPSAGHHP